MVTRMRWRRRLEWTEIESYVFVHLGQVDGMGG